MSTPVRRTLLCACLSALALPTAAGAAPVEVAPPGAEAKGGFSSAARAATNPGCRAKNVIAFRDQVSVKVRHTGLIRCSNVRVRITCAANLSHEGERISSLKARGSDRCRIGTPFARSDRYPAGDSFTQSYRYQLTLKNRRQKWSGTTAKCPKRSNKRRTLTCRGSHSTVAPNRSVDTIRS